MGVVLAIGVVSLIVLSSSEAIDANAAFYNVAEAGLGIGSLFFCALLFRAGLVPRWLAVGVSPATRASPWAPCWSCPASRAPRSSPPSPVDCSS
jgi:hypothetical protein